MATISWFVKDDRSNLPHCKLKVILETSGCMPPGFDDASDLELPIRITFFDRLAPIVQARAAQIAPGKSGFGMICKDFKVRGATCDVWITMSVSRGLPAKMIEELLATFIEPIVNRRLKHVFHEDAHERRLASRFVRHHAAKAIEPSDDLDGVLAEDPPTHPDVLRLIAAA